MSGTEEETKTVTDPRVTAFAKRPIKAIARATYDDTPLHVRYRAADNYKELAWSSFKIDESDLVKETDKDLKLYSLVNNVNYKTEVHHMFAPGSIVELVPGDSFSITEDHSTGGVTVSGFKIKNSTAEEIASATPVTFDKAYMTAGRIAKDHTSPTESSDTLIGEFKGSVEYIANTGEIELNHGAAYIGDIDLNDGDILQDLHIYARLKATENGSVTNATELGLTQVELNQITLSEAITFDPTADGTKQFYIESGKEITAEEGAKETTPKLTGVDTDMVYFDISYQTGEPAETTTLQTVYLKQGIIHLKDDKSGLDDGLDAHASNFYTSTVIFADRAGVETTLKRDEVSNVAITNVYLNTNSLETVTFSGTQVSDTGRYVIKGGRHVAAGTNVAVSTPDIKGVDVSRIFFDVTYTESAEEKKLYDVVLKTGVIKLTDNGVLDDGSAPSAANIFSNSVTFVDTKGEEIVLTKANISAVSVVVKVRTDLRTSDIYKFAVDIDERDEPVFTYILQPYSSMYYKRFGQFTTDETTASGTVALKEEIYARINAFSSKVGDDNSNAFSALIDNYNSSMKELVKLVNWINYYINDQSTYDTRDVTVHNNQEDELWPPNQPSTSDETYNTDADIGVLAKNDKVQVDLRNIKFMSIDKATGVITDSNVDTLVKIDEQEE